MGVHKVFVLLQQTNHWWTFMAWYPTENTEIQKTCNLNKAAINALPHVLLTVSSSTACRRVRHKFYTRMHSSRMRTALLLSVSHTIHCWGGVPGSGGCTWFRQEVYLVPGGRVPGHGGCTWSQGCVPGPGGTWGCVLGLGVCTCREVYLPGGVPGPRGYLVLGGVPGPMGV